MSETLFPTPLKLTVILIEEFEDTKRVIIIRESKKNRQHNGQNLENDKRIIRIRESKKDIQDNGVKKKEKRTNNDLQNTTQKTKDRATRIPLKTGGEHRCFGKCRYVHQYLNVCEI